MEFATLPTCARCNPGDATPERVDALLQGECELPDKAGTAFASGGAGDTGAGTTGAGGDFDGAAGA